MGLVIHLHIQSAAPTFLSALLSEWYLSLCLYYSWTAVALERGEIFFGLSRISCEILLKFVLQHGIVWIKFPNVVRLPHFVRITEKPLLTCQLLLNSLDSVFHNVTHPPCRPLEQLGRSVYRALLRSIVFQCVSITVLDGSYVKWAEETYIICIYCTTACQTINTPNSANIHMAQNKHRVSLLSPLDLMSPSHIEANLHLFVDYIVNSLEWYRSFISAGWYLCCSRKCVE